MSQGADFASSAPGEQGVINVGGGPYAGHMLDFDASQLRVLDGDPHRHARVLGAPGSGKSTLIAEAYARIIERSDFDAADVLILAPSRLAAAQLRELLEHRLKRAIGGTPVRTAVSLAFAITGRDAADRGRESPRLLTGTVADETISKAVAELTAEGVPLTLSPDVIISEQFRSELREFWRVLDDFQMTLEAARERILRAREMAAASAVAAQGPDEKLSSRWLDAITVIERAARILEQDRPHEISASGLRQAAALLLRSQEMAVGLVPRLILVDDAQQLGEGDLALLAACASRGSRIWAFGDPDIAAGAFQGERTAILVELEAELVRHGAHTRGSDVTESEQVFVLDTVHRHGREIRDLVSTLTARIGAARAGAQRQATALASAHGSADMRSVVFARAASVSEQIGALAYRLRANRLGVGRGAPLKWGDMAVICRSRAEVSRVTRLLAERQIPAGELAGGLVLREHRIVRDFITLLSHTLEIRSMAAAAIADVLSGPILSLDRMAVRRLRGSLLVEERRRARAEGRDAIRVDELMREAVINPGAEPVIDSAGGRALRRLGLILQAGQKQRDASGSAREILWAMWEQSGLAERLQNEALGALGLRSESAHRMLDAVVALFFSLQRHEEQGSEQSVAELLSDILTSGIAEDTLASRSARDEVIVTTPQGAIGFQFAMVCVLGPQDGNWPNLRAQGSLLGAVAFEGWLSGSEALATSRAQTLHDELRLFALACSRAREELLVLSIHDEEHHPGPFFLLGRAYEIETALPSDRLSLSGAVAQMRRRIVENPDDEGARASLVALAKQRVRGAHPQEWYGVMEASSATPLVDLEGDPDAMVPLSPSRLEAAEDCPLNWVIGRLGGSDRSVQADLGTLVHAVFENAVSATSEELFDLVTAEWSKLEFASEWENERGRELARAMVGAISDYLRQFDASGRHLLASEAGFTVPVGRSVLRGTADRLEITTAADGSVTATVVDLKTGKRLPTKAEVESHAQLQAYQLGVMSGAFDSHGESDVSSAATSPVEGSDTNSGITSGGARLLYVHPEAAKRSSFVELSQAPLSAEAQQAFESRVSEIARVIAGAQFTARVEHHCTNDYRSGNCALHIIPAVSYL